MVPQHPCLELIANSEQDISAMTSRRLLTYAKLFDVTQNGISDETNTAANMENFDDFRNKYAMTRAQNWFYLLYIYILFFFRFFSYAEDTRQERRLKQAALREHGRQEAMKRGKTLDENGKWNKVV